MLTISQDGYIRLSLAQLQAVKFRHLISVDESAADPSSGTVSGGYTEWVSDEAAAITLGWDWSMSVKNGRIVLERVGIPRSNCMLQDGEQNDLGYEATGAGLAEFVDTFAWRQITADHISVVYKPE